jgi:hypothetical protein
MSTVARRSVILGAVAGGAGLLLYLQRDLRSVRIMDTLLRRLGARADLRDPAVMGEPEPALLEQLWQLFTRMAARWQMAGEVELDENAFAQIIRAKTTLAPSYLTEYREARGILEEVERDMARDAAAFDQLFAVPIGLESFELTRLGRLQKFVIGEFLELQMAYGGFRAFGYRNYRGWAGGPLSDTARPPYRSQ